MTLPINLVHVIPRKVLFLLTPCHAVTDLKFAFFATRPAGTSNLELVAAPKSGTLSQQRQQRPRAQFGRFFYQPVRTAA